MILIINTILPLQFYGVIILRLVKLNCLNQDVFISIKLEHFYRTVVRCSHFGLETRILNLFGKY